MLERTGFDRAVGTGLAALDEVLGDLYWGDNVVWDLDRVAADPFYAAIAGRSGAFEEVIRVSVAGGGSDPAGGLDAGVRLRAGPGTSLPQPADLLREIQRLCHTPARRLLTFQPLDDMVAAWGAQQTRGFFARCCPLLLEAAAIAYWAMSTATPDMVRDTVRAVTQCILRVDQRCVRVMKAEGRGPQVPGSLLHWQMQDGALSVEPSNINDRVAASLRHVRETRKLTQHDLARLAEVTPSAISQAERGERGLSLGTVVRLCSALGITVDDLLRGEDPAAYRIGRRSDSSHDSSTHVTTLLGGTHATLRVDLVQLPALEATVLERAPAGTGIVAVAAGLVQVHVGRHTPALRPGEVLVADSQRVHRMRNLAHGESRLFWVVVAAADGGPPAAPEPTGSRSRVSEQLQPVAG